MRASAMMFVLLISGCYAYRPLETPTPAAGTRVVADLTNAGSLELASQIGPGVASVSGAVVAYDQEALLLALSSVMGRNDQETFWKGEQVRIPHTTVARLQQRRFALGKSFLFGGTVLGGLLGAIKAFEGEGSGGMSGGGGGPRPQ